MKNDGKNQFSPLLHLTYLLQQLTDENLLNTTGVGLSSARIMSALHGSPAVSQRTIAALLRQTEANVSRQLQVMRKQGLVKISKNKKDSRQRDVILTSKGSARYQAAIKLINNQQAEMSKLLTRNEKQAFDKAVANLVSGLNVIAATTRLL